MANRVRIADEIGKGRNQFDREIVDRIVAKVLEDSQDRGLTGSAQPGDDDQFRTGCGGARRGAGLLSTPRVLTRRVLILRSRQARSPAGRKWRVCRRAIS